VTNIIEHGYPSQPPGKASIELDLTVEPTCFRMIIEDHGLTFDPEDFGDIDVRKHVNEGRSGGLGVFLMRKIMDLIEYHSQKGKKNRLVLLKYANN
jgi:serine/threonine-protein kinase RsbW